jgi:hypothetical protein
MATYDPALDSVSLTSAPPAEYVAALEAAAPGITSQVAQQQQPGQSWTDSLLAALPILATTAQQRQLLQVQVDRAKQGLPPLDTSQYAIGAQVGMDANTRNLVMWGGLAVLALAFYALKTRR